MTYKEQLKDLRWLERREEIISLAGFRCEYCGDEGPNFQIHHGYYSPGRMAWEYPNEVLYCLCAECHHGIQELMENAHYQVAKRNIHIHQLINLIHRNVSIRTNDGFDLSRGNPLTQKCDFNG